ncbi:MAG TPA: hypothetical protein VFC06_03705 [Demequina sp.]|nr:hypothetical protein [Demequina sp.]
MNTLTVAPWTESMNTMPLSDLAVLSGVSLPALSQYKSGTKPMTEATAMKIAVAAAAGPDSVILAHGLSSFPAMGAVIKREHEADPSWCVSVLAQGIQQAKSHLVTDADIEAFHNKPVHVASPQWNALLHAAAVISWQQFKPGKPWWAELVPLSEPWSPIDHGKYVAQVWLATPILLREMNLIVGNGLTGAV